MGTITITNCEMMDDIEYGDNGWEIVEEGEWVQDHKYQYKSVIVKHTITGKYYQYDISRTGSPFTDWYYSYEDGNYPELIEVEKKERVVTESYWCVVL